MSEHMSTGFPVTSRTHAALHHACSLTWLYKQCKSMSSLIHLRCQLHRETKHVEHKHGLLSVIRRGAILIPCNAQHVHTCECNIAGTTYLSTLNFSASSLLDPLASPKAILPAYCPDKLLYKGAVSVLAVSSRTHAPHDAAFLPVLLLPLHRCKKSDIWAGLFTVTTLLGMRLRPQFLSADADLSPLYSCVLPPTTDLMVG